MHVRHGPRQTVNWPPIACVVVFSRCSVLKASHIKMVDSCVLPHDGRLSFGRARNGSSVGKWWWSNLMRRVLLAVGTRCSNKTISLPSRLSASVSVTFMAVIDVTGTSVIISEPNQSRLGGLSHPIQLKLQRFPFCGTVCDHYNL